MQSLILQISGMSCGHCLNAVNQALSTLSGVRIESVRIGRAEVRYDAAAVGPDQIVAAIADAGYHATPLAA